MDEEAIKHARAALKKDIELITQSELNKSSDDYWRRAGAYDENEYYQQALDLVKNFDKYENQDYNWKISHLQIFHVDGYPLYFRNFGTNLYEFDSSLIIKFRDTLNKFANNSLETSVVAFNIAEEILIILTENQYLFVIGLKVGARVLIGHDTPLYGTLNKLISELDMVLSVNLGGDIIEPELLTQAALTKHIFNVNIINNRFSHAWKLKKFEIDLVIITQPSGVPISTRMYRDTAAKEDPVLVSMFLHSIQVFYETNFEDELKFIQFTDRTLYLKKVDGIFYGIVVKYNDQIPISIRDPIHSVGDNLLNVLIQSLTVLGNIELIPEPVLNNVIDTFVVESTEDIKVSYRKRFVES